MAKLIIVSSRSVKSLLWAQRIFGNCGPRALARTLAIAYTANGYDGTSLRDIAEEAQITKAALYYHFPNKEALHQHIVIRNMQALIDRVGAAVKQAGSPTDKVRAFMLTSADFPICSFRSRRTLDAPAHGASL